MTDPTPISFPLFDFMDIRSPQALSPRRRRRGFIDDRDAPKQGQLRTTAFPTESEFPDLSAMARVVSDTVAAWTDEPSDPGALDSLKAAFIKDFAALQMVKYTPPTVAERGTPQVKFSDLETGVWLIGGMGDAERRYLLPDHPARLEPATLFDRVQAAGRVIDNHLAAGRTWDRDRLIAGLQAELNQPVDVFAWGSAPRNDDSWMLAHRRLFDALYLMYVTRRWTGFRNLEPLTNGLQTLHVIAMLGADLLLRQVTGSRHAISKDHGAMLDRLVTAWPELRRPFIRRSQKWVLDDLAFWDKNPLIGSLDDMRIFRDASPVIHPIFAQLFWRHRPFNDIKPIGCGDLKVVRDRLDRYHAVDIADIQNTMKGETRRRNHVRSEKSETTFSLEESTLSDTTRDTQTTERFELKAETERVLRDQTNLNLNANLSLTYGANGSPVQVTASAGMAYASSHSFEDHLKTSRTFARDVVDRAVERVETNRSISRSTSTVVETRERNFHEFTSPNSHTTGIYQWVEAEYTAQVFSYGRRTMFEFMIPEPAAFWVAARLAGYEHTLEVPQPPKKPVHEEVKLGFTWEQITGPQVAVLALEYGFEPILEPPLKKRVVLRRAGTKEPVFDNGPEDIPGGDPAHRHFAVDATLEGAAGYDVESVDISGGWMFHGRGSDEDPNGLQIVVDGKQVLKEESFNQYRTGENINTPKPGLRFDDDNVSVLFQFRRYAWKYSLALAFNLQRPDAMHHDWQQRVFNRVEAEEKKKVKQRNAERDAEYASALAQYKAAIAQVRATPISDLLAGGPQAENRRIIAMELKKHCISMVAKEFDSEDKDDQLEQLAPMAKRTVNADRTRLKVNEDPDLVAATTASFVPDPKANMEYPAINVAAARKKGRLVQFLDQAFEWEKISYLFFDYFYANMPRWVELINRDDPADPVWSAFLSAGQARVLLAVTPKYEVAVHHFLDTREPWNGTDADPVLDDPLFVPLFDEIRSRTDDRSGGTPCGDPWTYRVPVSLPYLRGSDTTLPDLEADRQRALAATTNKSASGGKS
jgi:hypothetical protein